MKKILILANDNSTIYNFRRELLARLLKEKFQVIISLPPNEKNEAFVKMGCNVEETTLSRFGKNPIKDFFVIKKYIKLIKQVAPDVVLTYTAKPNIYGSIACQKCRVPYINNVTGLGAAFQSESIIKIIMLLLQKLAYKKSKCVFFQNESNRRYFVQKRIVGDNANLLPGSGVNLNFNKFEQYPSNEETLRFITVSRVRKDKGFDELFAAIKNTYKKNKNVEFHIVGWYEDDNYRTILKEMQNNYPVIYHGSKSQHEVHDLISKCHCLIHPSHHEGMANVILEASASGRPCLVSNIAGCKEAIEDGTTGYLFKAKDAESLTNAINVFISLKNEDRLKMGILAREKMEMEFDRELVINLYMKEINQTCI